MEIRIRATGAVMTEEAFRAHFTSNVIPNPLTQEWLSVFGADIVLTGPTPTPEDSRYGFVYRDGEYELDGQWFSKFSVGPNLEGEALAAYKAEKDAAQAAQVRQERNQKLMATDWTQVKDAPAAISEQYAAYRQALRDLPAQAGFPWEVVWPTV